MLVEQVSVLKIRVVGCTGLIFHLQALWLFSVQVAVPCVTVELDHPLPLKSMSLVNKRRAWDGRYYTKAQFLVWYGQNRGLAIWNEAAPADLPGERACSRDLSEMVTVSFVLFSGCKACEDMVVTHTPGPSTRALREHLRNNSSEDGVRFIDWDSTLFIGDTCLDWECFDVFALEQAERMLTDTPGCFRLSVVRRPLWPDDS